MPGTHRESGLPDEPGLVTAMKFSYDCRRRIRDKTFQKEVSTCTNKGTAVLLEYIHGRGEHRLLAGTERRYFRPSTAYQPGPRIET